MVIYNRKQQLFMETQIFITNVIRANNGECLLIIFIISVGLTTMAR